MKSFNFSAFYSQICENTGKSVTSGTVNLPLLNNLLFFILAELKSIKVSFIFTEKANLYFNAVLEIPSTIA